MTSPGILTDRQLIDLCEHYLTSRQPIPLALIRELLTRFEIDHALIERAMDHQRSRLIKTSSTGETNP
jgi:hypothetical protein